MKRAMIHFFTEVRDFFQYAFGDREAVIARFSERNLRAWEKIYNPTAKSKKPDI